MAQQRHDELFAFRIVGELLSAEVEPYDIEGRQNAVDAMLHYPDKPDAALEISSVGEQDEARITNVLGRAKNRRDIPGLTNLWSVVVPKDFHPRDLPRIDAALLRCEAQGVDRLGFMVQDSESRDLLTRGVSADSMPVRGGTPPRAYIQVRGVGGFLRDGIEPLADELANALTTPKMQTKIAKLVDTGLDELHLFLWVRPSAFTFPVYDGLSFGEQLPSSPPRVPEEISQVWLLSGIAAGGVVRAVTGNGWRRNPVR